MTCYCIVTPRLVAILQGINAKTHACITSENNGIFHPSSNHYLFVFYLWMFCVNFNMFVLTVKFINDCWVFHHITIGLLEALNIYNVPSTKIMASIDN